MGRSNDENTIPPFLNLRSALLKEVNTPSEGKELLCQQMISRGEGLLWSLLRFLSQHGN